MDIGLIPTINKRSKDKIKKYNLVSVSGLHFLFLGLYRWFKEYSVKLFGGQSVKTSERVNLKEHSWTFSGRPYTAYVVKYPRSSQCHGLEYLFIRSAYTVR